MALTCRHCGAGGQLRRGLCRWTCYRNPGLRERYRKVDAVDTVHDFNGNARLPDELTAALPGTPAKVDVLAAKAAARRALWHPADAKVGHSQGLAVQRLPDASGLQFLGLVQIQGAG